MTRPSAKWSVVLTATLLALAGASAAQAEPPKPPPGSPTSGLGFAKLKCAACHAVEKSATVSPNLKAPPFIVIARSKMVTVREVDAWLQQSHQDMPDMGLDAHVRGDIIAYLQSLNPMDPMQ
jgi:mono/diheme cytochrome c family protein